VGFWIPKPTGRIPLLIDDAERELLSHIDGKTSLTHLGMLPGLSEPVVQRMLGRLIALGAVVPEERPDPPAAAHRPAPKPAPAPRPAAEPAPRSLAPTAEPAPALGADEAPTDERPGAPPAPLDDLQLSNFRWLYETQLKQMTRDQRLELAHTASGEILYALCLDPYPGVIEAILQNPTVELNHARMIARYHDKGIGLGHLARRSQFLNDPLVQRHLLRNVQTPQNVLQRMLRAKPLARLYKLNFSRELAEPATRVARQMFRSQFQTAPAEERIALVFRTEGRCLQMLPGIPLDEAFVALFVKRAIHSMLLVQSLARHSATPPSIIRHLWKQPVVKRQVHLRSMLLKHPNCPGEYKRPGAL